MQVRGVIGMTALGSTSDVDLLHGYAYEDVSACLRTARTCRSRLASVGQERRNNGHNVSVQARVRAARRSYGSLGADGYVFSLNMALSIPYTIS